jgi:hypothetical protein
MDWDEPDKNLSRLIYYVQYEVSSDKIMKILEASKLNDIQIKKVQTKKSLKEFILLPWEIYEDDPNWVPPLIREVKEKIDTHKNPFFEFSEMTLFLAYRGSAPAGRIAAVLNKNHNEFHDEKVVFFGLFECKEDQEAAKALLDAVVDWGKERGMEILRGPVNLSMNDECALLLEGFDSPPVIMMPYNPRYYLNLMEGYALEKVKDLHAYYMTKDHEVVGKVDKIAEEMRKQPKITLRTIDMKNIAKEVDKIREIYNQAWHDNWGFVPWTDSEIKYMAEKLKQIGDPKIVIIAEDKGMPVGFAFGLPNYNEILINLNGRLTPGAVLKLLLNRKKIKSMRALVFGVIKQYQQTGLSYLLYSELNKRGLEQGYEWCETSWQLEDNESINRFVHSIGGKIYKKYRIYEKNIV